MIEITFEPELAQNKKALPIIGEGFFHLSYQEACLV